MAEFNVILEINYHIKKNDDKNSTDNINDNKNSTDNINDNKNSTDNICVVFKVNENNNTNIIQWDITDLKFYEEFIKISFKDLFKEKLIRNELDDQYPLKILNDNKIGYLVEKYYSLIYSKNGSDVEYSNNKFNFNIKIKNDVSYELAKNIFDLMSIPELKVSKRIISLKLIFENFNGSYKLSYDFTNKYKIPNLEIFNLFKKEFKNDFYTDRINVKGNGNGELEKPDEIYNKNIQIKEKIDIIIDYELEFVDCYFEGCESWIDKNKSKVEAKSLFKDNPTNSIFIPTQFSPQFYKILFLENVQFVNCHFGILKDEKKEESKIETKTKIDFSGSIFEKDVSFENSTFYNKALFLDTTFRGNTNFHNTRFLKLVDFFEAQFYQKTIFYKTDFLEKSVFAKTIFHENVLFTYSTINTMILRQTDFKKGFDFSLCSSIDNLQIFNIYYYDKSYITVDSERTYNTENKKKEYEKNVTEEAIIPLINKKETYRIFKNQLDKIGDYTTALDFKKLEMKTYQQFTDLKSNEKIILWFNKCSNDFDSNWIQGVAFTFGCGILFSYLTLINTDNYFWDICLKNFSFDKVFTNLIKFMSPIHDLHYIENQSVVAYLFDFLGRIFVGYGIYQTIQAFRKYKSK